MTADVAFGEHMTDRLVIRRFRAEDAATLAEGHHLQSAWWKGEWVDEYVYAVLAPEWSERRTSV